MKRTKQDCLRATPVQAFRPAQRQARSGLVAGVPGIRRVIGWVIRTGLMLGTGDGCGPRDAWYRQRAIDQ
jgi:hypothetical protein